MNAIEEREKPAMVLLHGLLSDRRMWRYQLEGLATAYHVFNWDLPGFGAEPPIPPSREGMLDGLAGWVVERMKAQALAGAYLAGYSMGATLALKVAARAPRLVGRLALAAGAAKWGGGGRALLTPFPRLSYGLLRAKLKCRLRELIADPEALAEAESMIESADPRTGAALLSELLTRDHSPLLGRLGVPTLVVGGELDRLSGPARTGALAAGIRGSKYIELRGADHYFCVTRAEDFTRALTEFGAERN